jgi:hypothetical protein
MVPLHIAIFGHPPPCILDNIAVNLSGIEDWYVEAEFSYFRVFMAIVPPLALPLFIPNKLACREVSRQTMIGGVSKELKAYSKKVWPYFPIRLNSYSLLDFRHAKVEAVALEDLNLVSIEYKKHDPQKIVSNHLANCGLKRFEHDFSPPDDIFQGVRSYEEVLAWIRSLAPEDTTFVLKFQEHRRSCLPVVLQGGSPGVSETEPKDTEGPKDASPDSGKCQDEGKQTKRPEAEAQTPDLPKKQNLETETKTPEPPKKQDLVDTPGKAAKQIGEPITSVTPLQLTQGNIEEGWILNEELRPIRAEELPPNEFFFDKKRKAMVKREFYQEGESTVKKFKVMTDGKNKKNEKFAMEIVGTLGAYASTNQFSVGLLKNQLNRKNRLIRTVITEISSAQGDKNSASSKQKRSHSWHKVNSTAQQKGQKLYKMTKNLKGALHHLGARAYACNRNVQSAHMCTRRGCWAKNPCAC